MPIFTPHQDAALKAVAAWLKDGPGSRGTPQIFRLFGYAGTGKTTLARHLAEGVDGDVVFGAFTGKAALVMRRKGCQGATTIHSLIYKPIENNTEQPSFELWDEAPASKAKWSSALTSCIFPLEMWTKQGMLPRRSMSVWSLTAALRLRKEAQGNRDRHRSIVVESKA